MRTRDEHQQLLIDEAKLFCRGAVAAITHEDWETATQVLLDRCKKLDIALQSLTPGGSEYVGDPERCVARVREQMETYRKLWRDACPERRVTKP